MNGFRKRSFGVVLSLLTFGLAWSQLNTSAQVTPPNGSAAEQPPIELLLPTEEDKQLARQFAAVTKELDQPFGMARELINSMRSNEWTFLPAILESTKPVNSRILSRARRYVSRTITRLEAAQKLKPPAPQSVTALVGKITIDGKLNELSWKRARESRIQFLHWEKAKSTAATARLLWDQEFLYVGFSVPDTNIIAPKMQRDSEVWRFDCIELFLMPDKELGKYWEIEISPTGSILDYLCTKYPNQWGSDMQAAETIKGLKIGRTIRGTANQGEGKDDGYIIEVAVPLAQLPGFTQKPEEGSQIHALLGWVNNDSDATSNATTSLAQVPFLTWFHNVWAYQPFIFADERGQISKVKPATVALP